MNREIDTKDLDRRGGKTRSQLRRELNNLFDIAELETNNFDFSSMITAVMRRKWSVALITVLFGALAWWHLQNVTPLYPAGATVVLDTKDEQVIDIEAVTSGLSSDFFQINTEVEVLKSRRLLARLVDDMKLTEDPEFNPFISPPAAWTTHPVALSVFGVFGIDPGEKTETPAEIQRNETILQLSQRLDVDNIDATYVFTLEIETQDRQKSADLINRLARLYILEQLEAKFEATQSATRWLSGRVADLKIALEKAEASVETYKTTTQLVSEEELEIESRKLKDLRDRADVYTVEAAETEALLASIATLRQDQNIELITDMVDSPRLTRAAAQLDSIKGESAQAKQRRTLALSNYWKELDSRVLQLRQQLERSRKQAEAAIPAIEEFEA
ncbi:MAG: Wzz/FepE/Etk N-terminal domain-containing protein, partial [Pseudomonadota bacterium]